MQNLFSQRIPVHPKPRKWPFLSWTCTPVYVRASSGCKCIPLQIPACNSALSAPSSRHSAASANPPVPRAALGSQNFMTLKHKIIAIETTLFNSVIDFKNQKGEKKRKF